MTTSDFRGIYSNNFMPAKKKPDAKRTLKNATDQRSYASDETLLNRVATISNHVRSSKKFDRDKSDVTRPPPKPSVYLWLCCEGWMKFGPFEWLRFDDESHSILGPEGEEIAKKLEGQWRVPGEKWQGLGFSDPTITTTPVHPHKASGSHPSSIR